MSESKFKKGDFVRKTKGSWWEGRVVGFYDTAENPDGVAVQLDKPNGPVQIYPAAAMELMPEPTDQVVGSEPTIIRLPWHREPDSDFWRAEVVGHVYEVHDDEMADYKKRQCQYDFEARIRSALVPPATKVVGPEDRGIRIGMAIAAGIIMRSWGQDVYAREILGAAGLDTLEKLKASGVDQYDIDALMPIFAATATEGSGDA